MVIHEPPLNRKKKPYSSPQRFISPSAQSCTGQVERNAGISDFGPRPKFELISFDYSHDAVDEKH